MAVLLLLGLILIAGHRFFAWGLEAMMRQDQVTEQTRQRMRQFYLGLGLTLCLSALMTWLLD
ncbi:MAG: hypothetical protein ABR505_02600 [Actinomycetota bacterium]